MKLKFWLMYKQISIANLPSVLLKLQQLKTFNQRLLDLIDERKHTAVDGIILSKFDTVGDKIGAAISMVYSNNITIIFLCCGQTYTDLRRLDVETFAKVLSN